MKRPGVQPGLCTDTDIPYSPHLKPELPLVPILQLVSSLRGARGWEQAETTTEATTRAT